ncbi:hypothetical protein [Streptomyces sp. NPDC093089]|uniref:hypothetical protein n=1 Tax=Streptomyces sp. NPDC093089 TaxID=3366024 RepID=UPI00382579C0
MSGHGGGARWNDETQSWERGPVSPPTGPPDPGAAPHGGGHGGAYGAGYGAGYGAAHGPVVPPPPPDRAPEYGPGTTPEYGPGVAPEYGPGTTPGYGPGASPGYGPGHAPQYDPETGGWQYPVAGTVAADRPRSRTALAAGVAVAVLAAGSVGGWLVWGRDDAGTPAAGGPEVSVSVSVPVDSGETTTEPTTGSTASDSPPGTSSAPADDVPPPGYSEQQDLKGFTIAVPEGWDRTESDQGVFFNAPDRRSLIQVFVVQDEDMTPYDALRGASDDGRANKPGYQEISLERVTGEPGAPSDAAELVYAYDRDGGRRKVVDRAFTAADGTHYAILAAGPESDWPKQRERLGVALKFFRPGAY